MPRPLPALGLPLAGLLLVLAGATWAVHVEVVQYTHHSAGLGFPLAPPAVGGSIGVAAGWTSRVVAPGVLLLWVAVRGSARPVVTGAVGIGATAVWALLGQLPPAAPLLPWPGPQTPYDWAVDTPLVGLAHPARAVPVLVLVAALLTALGATAGRREPLVPDDGVRAPGATTARFTLVGLALVCGGLAVASAYAAGTWPGASWQDVAATTEVLGTAVLVLALVVAGTLGSGRSWAVVPLALAWVAGAAVPWTAAWFSGGQDVLLLPPVLAASATLLAWLWRPCALGFEVLVRPARPSPAADGAAADRPQGPNGPTLTTDRG